MSVSNTAKQRKNTVVINPNLIRIHYFITYVIETKVTKKLEWFQIGKALPGFYKCHQDVFTSRNTTDNQVAL